MKNGYDNVWGTWEVSTEGDCEGKSTTDLGTFTGFVDEIALHLANKAYYSLNFKRIAPVTQPTLTPTRDEVHVQFDIESGTWGSVKTSDGLIEVSNAFIKRPVIVTESNFYASFKLTSTSPDVINRKKALAKLTAAERKLLGL